MGIDVVNRRDVFCVLTVVVDHESMHVVNCQDLNMCGYPCLYMHAQTAHTHTHTQVSSVLAALSPPTYNSAPGSPASSSPFHYTALLDITIGCFDAKCTDPKPGTVTVLDSSLS